MYYNLDAIISVGYRVNSKKATQFRIWATKILKEYLRADPLFEAAVGDDTFYEGFVEKLRLLPIGVIKMLRFPSRIS